MTERFFGSTSSHRARDAYAPVSAANRSANVTLGKNTSAILLNDPKLIGFTIAKHKFVGKMLNGRNRVLEIGCMDGLGSAIVCKFVGHLTSIDYYREHIEQAQAHIGPHLANVTFKGADILDGGFFGFDAGFALDVLEHIDPAQEDEFLRQVCAALVPDGIFIVGMPSVESQVHASEANRRAHINCQSADQLTATLSRYFRNVFSFGMNDEVIHTGFGPMSHYLLKVCVGLR
ncbi:MAG: class I SAM-dependent methyltransferase [Rhodospirillaceae bacterium]|nr:class I SAM-dependent methyltransferase [Rhodospirillaceae bacterium]